MRSIRVSRLSTSAPNSLLPPLTTELHPECMDAETVRATLLKLPHVVETMQWGENLVYWVGDKAIGGKMFAVVNLDAANPGHQRVMSFSAGPERFAELVEREGVVPAPYMARIHWVALERWIALPSTELLALLKSAHELTYNKLPKRTKDTLVLPPAEFGKLLMDRKNLLATRAAEEKMAKEKLVAAKSAAKARPQHASRNKK